MRIVFLAVATLVITILACQGEPVTVVVPADTPTPQPTSTPYPTPEPTAAPTPAAQSDREALIALYHATNGPGWVNSEKWPSDDPIWEWYGVKTGSAGRVTELVLRDNNLVGQIPPELGDLANLESLELHYNQLSGEIPPELGDLASLITLDLRGNDQLRGCIPKGLQGQGEITSSSVGFQFCP